MKSYREWKAINEASAGQAALGQVRQVGNQPANISNAFVTALYQLGATNPNAVRRIFSYLIKAVGQDAEIDAEQKENLLAALRSSSYATNRIVKGGERQFGNVAPPETEPNG